MSDAFRGELKLNEPLAQHTSWHIGGPADKYYRPVDLSDLSLFLASLPSDTPITWLGLGSNVLIPDEGIRGVVIHMLPPSQSAAPAKVSASPLAVTETSTTHKIIRAEAGIPCAKVAKFCAKQGLAEGEFFAGIPGTVGGALAMNAGAFGGETWPRVVQVEVINRQGEIKIRKPSDYQISYRTVKGPTDEWFVAGYFQLPLGDSAESAQRIKALLRQRNESQPIGVFSCGSVFKNPENDYAGRLIEASNLKGFRIGDAQISPKHANFILNLGNARATDILQLIQHIQAVVLKEHQVQLQTEVRFLSSQG